MARAAIGALLVAWAATTFYLIHLANGYYRASLEVRLDPAGLHTYEAARAAAPPAAPVLVLLGDSRAQMWSAPSTLGGFHVVNRGVSWQTTAQILLRVQADVVSLHPSVVVVEAGVNDLKSIAELPQRRPEIVATCESNLAHIVEECRSAGAKVVVATVFDIGAIPLWRRPFWSSDVAAAVAEVNTYLQRLAGDGVVVFDANPLLTGGALEIEPAYQLDYLHLNAAAYEALDQGLLPVLADLHK